MSRSSVHGISALLGHPLPAGMDGYIEVFKENQEDKKVWMFGPETHGIASFHPDDNNGGKFILDIGVGRCSP